MYRSRHPALSSDGYILLEALIAMVIFAVSVLGLLGLQAASIRNNSDAKYRADASFLVSRLVGQMSSDIRVPATLQANYQGGSGTDGAKYAAWVADVQSQLPRATEQAPQVNVTSLGTKSTVTIRVFWASPGEDFHNFVASTEISQ